jgi:RND family efflux transporter MFP subunit
MVRLTTGDKATLQFDAYPNIDFTATVTEIAQIADPAKGTFEIELRVDPQGRKLATGMVAKVQIMPSQTQNSLMVPIEALIEADGNQGYVYVLNSDKQSVKKVPVKIGGIYDSLVGISEGLTDQSTIITAGNHYLTQDSKVKIVN